jgi:hypothetical protein
MAHKIIKLLSYVAKMAELIAAKTIGFNIPKMAEFTITKWLKETRKWLTQAPNGWANTKNGKDAWVRTRRVGRFMRECFNSCGHVGTLRLEQGWHIAYVYIYRAIVYIYIYIYMYVWGNCVCTPISKSNCNFTLHFSTLWYYPHDSKMNKQFTPILFIYSLPIIVFQQTNPPLFSQ